MLKWAMPLSIAILASPSAPAFAMVGENLQLVNEGANPSVCLLQIKASGEDGGFCTGVLVSPNTVLTAAHCFGENYDSFSGQTIITCGGQYLGKASRVTLPPADVWQDEHHPDPKDDSAVVTLMFNAKNEVAAAASSKDLYVNASGFLLPNVRCKMIGYGYSGITGHYQRGSLVEASLDAVRVQFTTLDTFVTSPSSGTTLETSVDHGDSGGPMFCQAPGHDVELIGTIVNYTTLVGKNPYHNTFTPVWLHEF